ncbi:MAG: inositol monophosphatase family protein [Cyanobacteriota/Melainabacteria group bacterium]
MRESDSRPDQIELSEDQNPAEESGEKDGAVNRRWLIDPLDGTTNYSHAYPFFAVSIGLEQEGEMVLGVVYKRSAVDEMLWAIKGEGF